MGLIQRVIEARGIATVSIGNCPERSARIKPPRRVEVKLARGSMFGEPGNASRQRRIVLDMLEALRAIQTPGEVIQLPYRWKRPDPAAGEG